METSGGDEQLRAAARQMEELLRERLELTDPMHPDNPEYAGSPRGMLWWQAASWIVNQVEEE